MRSFQQSKCSKYKSKWYHLPYPLEAVTGNKNTYDKKPSPPDQDNT